MESSTAKLLIKDHTIDHDKRLSIDIQRVNTIHKHHTTESGNTATGSGMHISTKVLLHFFLNRYSIRETEVGSRLIGSNVCTLCIFCTESNRIEQHVALVLIGYQTNLCHVAIRGTDFNRGSKERNLDLIGAIAARQCTIAIHLCHTYHGTRDRSLGCSIEHTTFNDTCRILLARLGRFLLSGSIHQLAIVLLSCHWCYAQHEEREAI